MFLFRKPSLETIQKFLAGQARFDLTYTAVGATSTVPPSGYAVNHTRIRIGTGETVFQAAKFALRRWEQFRLGWLEVRPPEIPLEVGQNVAILARSLGLWWLNACRIVTVVDDVDRFGFAYGTLPDHAGTGEERFLIEWDHRDDSVWYDILAFSRPYQFLVRLGRAYMRVVQKRFGRESGAAMLKAIHHP